MPDPPSTPDDLTTLLERVDVSRAGESAASGAPSAHVDRLLARVAMLTDALRVAPANDVARLAARVLLDDLTMVAAQFRSDTNATRTSLTRALEELGTALEAIDKAS